MKKLPDSVFDDIVDDSKEIKRLPDSVFDDSPEQSAAPSDSLLKPEVQQYLNQNPRLNTAFGIISGGLSDIAQDRQRSKALQAFATAIPKGYGSLGVGIAKYGDRAINALLGTHLQAPDPFDYSKNDTSLGDYLGSLEKENPGFSLAGNLTGATFGPGLSKAMGLGVDAAKGIASGLLPGAPRLASVLGSMAGTGALAGMQNTLLNPDKPIGETFGNAAKFGAAFGLAPALVSSAIGRSVSPEDAAAAIAAAQRTGTTLSAAELSNRPQLNRQVKNTLQLVPSSGVSGMYEKASQNLNNQLGASLDEMKGDANVADIPKNIQKALIDTNKDIEHLRQQPVNALNNTYNAVLSDLKGTAKPEDIPKILNSSVRNLLKEKQADKYNMFNEVDNRANEIGANPEPTKYRKALKEILDTNKSKLFSEPENQLPSPLISKIRAFYNATGAGFQKPEEVVNYLNAVGDHDFENPREAIEHLNENYDANLSNNRDLLKYANQLRPKSFKGASLAAYNLRDMADSIGGNDILGKNKYAQSLLHKARGALLEDMEDSANNAGDPELFQKYNQAKEFYKNEIKPFDDPSIKKYLREDADPDLIIRDFLKPGQYEQVTRLKKLTDKLPDDQKKLLAYYHLTKDLPVKKGKVQAAINNLDNWEKLSDQTKSILVGDRNKSILDDINLLRNNVNNPDSPKDLPLKLKQFNDFWQTHKRIYNEKIAPFDDPDIKKFAKEGGDPDSIVQKFVRTGQYAHPTILKKILDKLPEDKKNQLAYYFLTKNMPQKNGRVIASANGLGDWDNLEDSMKDLLVSPKHKQVLNDVSLLRKRVPDVYFNPQTGAQVGYSNFMKSMGAAGLAAATGNHLALGGVLGTLAAAPIITSILKNPSVIRGLAFGTKVPSNVLAPLSAGASGYLAQEKLR